MFKLRKYDNSEVEEIKHLYWQMENAFEEMNLKDKTKKTPMSMTKEIYGIADTTLRRCLIYGTDEHEKYKEKERKRAKIKRNRRKNLRKGKKERKKRVSGQIQKNIRKKELKKFYRKNKENELILNKDMAGLFKMVTFNETTAKMIDYFQKNGDFHLKDVYMNFGEDGLKSMQYLYENGYIEKR